MFTTYNTIFGKVTIYTNETFISLPFQMGSYWGIDTLLKIKPYIDPAKNIIEIGGHCGTSSLVYASFLNDDQKIYVYEPQKKNVRFVEVQHISKSFGT